MRLADFRLKTYPAVGDNVSKTTRYSLSSTFSPKIIGELIMEEGASFANKSERYIATKLLDEGKNVFVFAEKHKKQIKGQTPDFLVDGIEYELKTISDISTPDLSGRIADKIREAVGQSGNVLIDLRKQQGATREIAEKAIERSFGKSDKLKKVRIIGEDFDLSKTR